jgi:hypothetical protein
LTEDNGERENTVYQVDATDLLYSGLIMVLCYTSHGNLITSIANRRQTAVS